MSKKLRDTHWQATFNFQEKAASVRDSFLAHIPVHTGEQVCICSCECFPLCICETKCVCVRVQSINSWCVQAPQRFYYNRESSEAQGLPEERLADAVSLRSINSIKSQVIDSQVEEEGWQLSAKKEKERQRKTADI